MKEISLTKGYVALVDDVDYDVLNAFKWCAFESDTNVYAGRAVYDLTAPRHQRHAFMHRELLGLGGVKETGVEVDHKDRVGLHNWRDNLRQTTHEHNVRNRRAWGKHSAFKGAYRRRDRWESYIVCAGSREYLGTFDTDVEAAIAYNTAASRLFGEFACLNTIPKA